jgi:transcriptional regulator with XRE-family HTH domain
MCDSDTMNQFDVTGHRVLQNHKTQFERVHLRILGRRIRALREARKWSLKRLSVNSGASVAAIQKIEFGSASPRLATVIAIIEALGESVDQLITASRKPDRVVKVVRGQLPVSSKANVDLSPSLTDRRMHCILNILPARQAVKSIEVGRGGEPLFGHVLVGALRVSFNNGDAVQLAVGDSFHASADTSGEWSNPGARRCLVLCISDGDASGAAANSKWR